MGKDKGGGFNSNNMTLTATEKASKKYIAPKPKGIVVATNAAAAKSGERYTAAAQPAIAANKAVAAANISGANLTGTAAKAGYTPTAAPSGSGSSGSRYTPPVVSKAAGTPITPVTQVPTPSAQPETMQPPVMETPQLNPYVQDNSAAGQGSGGTGGGFQGIRDAYASGTAADKAEMAANAGALISYIDTMGAQITDSLRAQMGMDDPQIQQAIALIKDEATRMHQEMLEDLNAKGIVQSGLYARAQMDLNKTSGQNVSSFVSQRFGDLQNQLNSALMSLGGMRVSAMQGNNASMASFNQNKSNNLASMDMQNQGQQIQRDQMAQNQNQFQQQFDWGKQTYNQDSATQKDQFGQTLQANRENAQLGASSGGAGNALGWAQFEYGKQQDVAYRGDYELQTAAQNASQWATGINSYETYKQALNAINTMPVGDAAKNYAKSIIDAAGSKYSAPTPSPQAPGYFQNANKPYTPVPNTTLQYRR